MISDKEGQIRDSLANKEYRDALAVEHVNTTLAIQIRKMRENHQWRQCDLADQLQGKHQETISQWENPDYGRYSITTLKELATTFDVALLVKFIPFSELVKDMISLSEIRLSPPSFSEEQKQSLPLVLTTANSMENKADTNTPIYMDVNFANIPNIEDASCYQMVKVNSRGHTSSTGSPSPKPAVYTNEDEYSSAITEKGDLVHA